MSFVPGLTDREIWITVLYVGWAVAGCLGNYLYHKWDTGAIDTITWRSIGIKVFFGVVVGGLLSLGTHGSLDVPHEYAVLTGFTTGIVAEKYLSGFFQKRKNAKNDG